MQLLKRHTIATWQINRFHLDVDWYASRVSYANQHLSAAMQTRPHVTIRVLVSQYARYYWTLYDMVGGIGICVLVLYRVEGISVEDKIDLRKIRHAFIIIRLSRVYIIQYLVNMCISIWIWFQGRRMLKWISGYLHQMLTFALQAIRHVRWTGRCAGYTTSSSSGTLYFGWIGRGDRGAFSGGNEVMWHRPQKPV